MATSDITNQLCHLVGSERTCRITAINPSESDIDRDQVFVEKTSGVVIVAITDIARCWTPSNTLYGPGAPWRARISEDGHGGYR